MGTLSQFIYQIEKGPMALKLDSVQLDAHDDAGQQLTLDLQISGLASSCQQQNENDAIPQMDGAGAGAGKRLVLRRAIEPRARPDVPPPTLRRVQFVHHGAQHF